MKTHRTPSDKLYPTRKISQRHILYPLYSVLLFALATPNALFPDGIAWLGYIALVPLFIIVREPLGVSYARRMGMLFGAAITVLQHSWLAEFETYAFWALAGPTVVYICYYFVLMPLLFAYAASSDIYRPFRIAVVWTLFEFLKSVGYLGFPWGMLANLGAQMPVVAQIADTTAMWGLSFFFALSNAVIAECFDRGVPPRQRRQQHIFLAALITLCLCYGWYRLSERATPQSYISTVLVQPNKDPWTDRSVDDDLLALQKLSEEGIAELGKSPDLLVWPETALFIPYSEPYWDHYLSVPAAYPLLDFLGDQDSYLLSGSALFEDNLFYNGAVLLDPEGLRLGSYAKQHLVPLGESIPGWEIPVIRNFFTETLGLYSSWEAGSEASMLILPREHRPLRIAPLICFEDSFANISREFVGKGADILVNLTNNSWSDTHSTLVQHFSAAWFRSVETRRTLIRVGNNGKTQVIDPWGRVLHEIPTRQANTLAVAEVPVFVPEKESFYQRFGNIFVAVQGALLILISATGRYRKRSAIRTPSS